MSPALRAVFESLFGRLDLADSLEAARKSGIFLDDVVIGKMRSDWEPGPGYDYVKARTYSPSSN